MTGAGYRQFVSARRYADSCGVARALDRVGERWALLVVRELLLGPKRFRDLLRGLDGISANVLTHRLKELEAAGVVRRAVLGPPVGGPVYELTAWGCDLEPVLLTLASWGSRAPLPQSSTMSADAFALSLRTTYQAGATAGVEMTVNLSLGVDQFILVLGNASVAIARGQRERADLDLASTVDTMRTVLYAGGDVEAAIADGRLSVRGSRGRLRRFLDCFERPSEHPDALGPHHAIARTRGARAE